MEEPPRTTADKGVRGSRWRTLNRCCVLAERLVEDLEPDGYPQLLVLCAAHPAMYMGLVLNAASSQRHTAVTQRLPMPILADSIGAGRGTRSRRIGVQAEVRVVRGGCVKLNASHTTEPAAAATAHLQLMGRLCTSAKFPLTVDLVCLDREGAIQLLMTWEQHGEVLGFTAGNLHLQGGSVLGECVRANGGRPLLHALGGVVVLRVTASPRAAENAAIKRLETLTGLQVLSVDDVPLRGISSAGALQSLRRASFTRALIGDDDVRVLASLLGLEDVSLRDCPYITSVDALGALSHLSTLIADGCQRMFRVAGVAAGPSLHIVDLSENPFLKEAEIAKLLMASRHIEDLCLARLCLPSAESFGLNSAAGPLLAPSIRRLNLSGTTVRGTAAVWLARMPHLQQLHLAGSTVTDELMNEMFTCSSLSGLNEPSQVEVLALENCRQLYTSLGFAMRLPYLATLSISAASLAAENCVAQLRQCGKDIAIQ